MLSKILSIEAISSVDIDYDLSKLDFIANFIIAKLDLSYNESLFSTEIMVLEWLEKLREFFQAGEPDVKYETELTGDGSPFVVEQTDDRLINILFYDMTKKELLFLPFDRESLSALIDQTYNAVTSMLKGMGVSTQAVEADKVHTNKAFSLWQNKW